MTHSFYPPLPPFLSLLELTCALPWKLFHQKVAFPFPLPSSACQELHLKWLADATPQCDDCWRVQCVTTTRCVRLHHSFPTSQINQALFGRGRWSPCLHLMLSNRSRAEEWAEKLVERCSFNLSWPPSLPQASSSLFTFLHNIQHGLYFNL